MAIFGRCQCYVIHKSGRGIYSKLLLLVELDHDSWLHGECDSRVNYGAQMLTVISILFISQNPDVSDVKPKITR